MRTGGLASRRELIVTSARVFCIAALIAGAALLTLRNGRAACGRRTACDSCRLRNGCDLATETGPRPR